jgi:serine/threonine protein kinase
MIRTPVTDWQQLAAMYELADALDAESLDDWLVRLAAQPHPLLPQLKQMLDDRARAPFREFFENVSPPPPVPPAPQREVAWREGARFGPYRLQRRLPDDDLAEVWLAQRADMSVRRPDVIKLMPRRASAIECEKFARRFERDRETLVAMSHSYIAGLQEAGVTASGRPWIAHEYVVGEPLTRWCDKRQLGIAARLELFRKVVLAVRHAHSHLVLHRDLRPANILVTPQGDVRVLDFGMLQLMEPEGIASVETEIARLSGTPALPWYAAPEQLLGQPLTTACDVYALGVMLYELLCGRRPDELKFESAALLEQSILDTTPRPPSQREISIVDAQLRGTTPARLRRTLAGDLDALVLKMLAKQPAQRCVSVEALRAELDRWFTGVPLESRASGRWGRAGRFLKRHVERIAAL